MNALLMIVVCGTLILAIAVDVVALVAWLRSRFTGGSR
jgi:hypothetical protein